MTDAQTILGMIESVDPSDTAKLDEIDNMVELYLKNTSTEIIPYHAIFGRAYQTEELAETHAIIQSLEWERKNADNL